MPEQICATDVQIDSSEADTQDDVDDVVQQIVARHILRNQDLRFHALPWVRAEFSIGLCCELMKHTNENVRRYAARCLQEWRRFYPELVSEYRY